VGPVSRPVLRIARNVLVLWSQSMTAQR
jgi:hypothetical protein